MDFHACQPRSKDLHSKYQPTAHRGAEPWSRGVYTRQGVHPPAGRCGRGAYGIVRVFHFSQSVSLKKWNNCFSPALNCRHLSFAFDSPRSGEKWAKKETTQQAPPEVPGPPLGTTSPGDPQGQPVHPSSLHGSGLQRPRRRLPRLQALDLRRRAGPQVQGGGLLLTAGGHTHQVGLALT